MEITPSSEKPNSQSVTEESRKSNEDKYVLRDSDVQCPQGTSSLNNTILEEPPVNNSGDLPQEEALPSLVPKRKRKRARKTSAPINDDSDPDCLKGVPSVENTSSEKISSVQSLGRNVHHESPHGTDTLLEEPSVNIISDLVPVPPHADLSRRKRKGKKTKISAVSESDSSFLESCAGICTTPNSEKANEYSDLLPLQRKMKKKQNKDHEVPENNDRICESPRTYVELNCSQRKMKNKKKMRQADESSYKSCDLLVGTSSVENIILTVDQSLQPSVSEVSEQELEVVVAQPPMEGISTLPNSESSEPIAYLSCSSKKKKRKQKRRSETQESNDGSCGNDKKCDISVCTSLEENILPGLDPCQQPSVSEFSEQKLELPQPLTGVISTKTNSESSEPFADLSSPRKSKKQKRKKKSKTLESCGNDNKCDPSFSTLVENILPGTGASQQPPVSGFSEQKLELSQPLIEGISTEASSEGPKPNVSCSQENQKKKTKRKHKTFEHNDERCDLSVGTSSGGNIMPGVDLLVQPPVEVFSEQEQPLMEGISREASSEGPKPNTDVSCSQENEKKKKKGRHKTLDPMDINESSILEKKNGLQNSADGGSRSKIEAEINCTSPEWVNMKTYRRKGKDEIYHEEVDQSCNPVLDLGCFKENGVNGTSSHCSDAFAEAKDITDTERTETKIEVPSLLPLSVEADVGVAVPVKGEDLSHISDSAVERSIVTSSKRKLLILDVNGLLADIVQWENFIPNRFEPDTTISKKAVFKRPFCDDFLQFCLNKFNVGVWSSRTKKNVDLVMNFLLGNSKCKLLFCWNQSHCTTTRFSTLGNENKPIVLKELKKLWEKVDPDLPWVRGEYNESNTLLLDDSPYKGLSNPPDTAIFPYSYQYRDTRDTSLGPGGDIRAYLEGIAAADNVQEYVRQHPFGQRPITEKHLRWNFYSKIVADLKRESKR